MRRALDTQREDEKKERDAVYFDNMTFWMSGVLLEPDWENHMFLLLSVSYFNVKSDESIFPAELAIAKFNLRGMLETRHLVCKTSNIRAVTNRPLFSANQPRKIAVRIRG